MRREDDGRGGKGEKVEKRGEELGGGRREERGDRGRRKERSGRWKEVPSREFHLNLSSSSRRSAIPSPSPPKREKHHDTH